jgi:alpha-tubulin suppressor-like RCC1 family protein
VILQLRNSLQAYLPSKQLLWVVEHSCGIDAVHQLWCWGANDQHQVIATGGDTIVATPQIVLSGVSHVALGFTTTCARLQIGQTSCWGDSTYGQLGNGSHEYDPTHPYVRGLNDGFVIATGGDFSCTVLKHVVARCWGGNEYGQIGDGTTNTAALPQTSGVTMKSWRLLRGALMRV